MGRKNVMSREPWDRNHRLKPRFLRITYITPSCIGEEFEQGEELMALEGIDTDGRTHYLLIEPDKIEKLGINLIEVSRQGWFRNLVERYRARQAAKRTRADRAA